MPGTGPASGLGQVGVYSIVTSEHVLQICGLCSQSQRKLTTYSPGGTWGILTLSTTLNMKKASWTCWS